MKTCGASLDAMSKVFMTSTVSAAHWTRDLTGSAKIPHLTTIAVSVVWASRAMCRPLNTVNSTLIVAIVGIQSYTCHFPSRKECRYILKGSNRYMPHPSGRQYMSCKPSIQCKPDKQLDMFDRTLAHVFLERILYNLTIHHISNSLLDIGSNIGRTDKTCLHILCIRFLNSSLGRIVNVAF